MSGSTALNPASREFFPGRLDTDTPSLFQNGRASIFSASPRASPGPSDAPRSNENPPSAIPAGLGGALHQQGPLRTHTPVFRATFEEHSGIYNAVRVPDGIAPDQREPFITVDSPPSSGNSPSSAPPPIFRSVEGERPYPPVEIGFNRERSLSGHFDTTDDPIVPASFASSRLNRQPSLGASSIFTVQRQPSFSANMSRQPSESFYTPPGSSAGHNGAVQIQTSAYSSSGGGFIPSSSSNSAPEAGLTSSPVSSVSAPSSGIIPVGDKSFEALAKNSPFLHDILDRVIRTEYAQRDISREIATLAANVNKLLERFESGVGNRPFLPSPIPGANGLGGAASHLSVSPTGSGIVQGGREDPEISKRLDALTHSVQQMLLIQQQQQAGPSNTSFPPNPNGSQFNGGDQISPNISLGSSPTVHTNLPNRPPQRTPGPPLRAFSTGNLDLPLRPEAHLNRPENFLAQKRRSVVGNLARRDSSATVDSDWGGNSPRDGGGAVTKWEHLPLVPELLRSISKFGVGPPNKIQQRALPFLLNGADIIAQAPPTQERIAAYVIPAIHIALTALASKPQNRGPIVLVISTTVDQATQAQRMIRDLGGNIGVRSALGVGTGGDVQQEIRLLHQSMPHVLCGTPQKLHSLFTTPGGLPGNEIRFIVLDEVDQLIARNLHDFVFNIVKLLPAPRPAGPGSNTSSAFSPFEAPPSNNGSSPSGNGATVNRRFPAVVHTSNPNDPPGSQNASVKRQTALFSNTVPQDVLNLANAIQLREPVRVLVRRDGNVTSTETHSGGTRGLRQYYLYLAFTAGGGNAASGRLSNAGLSSSGLGIIGSGRAITSSAEAEQAKEWKLEALADLFVDLDLAQAIIHVNSLATLDSVTYKLASRGLEAIPLHQEMNAGTKVAALNKFRGGSVMRQPTTRVLVVFEVQVKSPDVFQVPLVVNYDLPKVVEDYAHRVAPAISSNYSRAGVVINFVTATGGDVEMLRSIECYYKIKCPEVPISLRDVL